MSNQPGGGNNSVQRWVLLVILGVLILSILGSLILFYLPTFLAFTELPRTQFWLT
jgi:hypothetical protein